MSLKNRRLLLDLISVKKHDLHQAIKDHVEERKEKEEKKNTFIALFYWYRRFRSFIYGLDQRSVTLSNRGFGKPYKEFLEGRGNANWTVRLHLNQLTAALNKLDIPHELDVKKLLKDYSKKSVASEDYFMTDDEVKQLLNVKLRLKKEERIILDRFIIACFTGARLSEIPTVRIDVAGLKYTAGKTSKDVTVPYSENVIPFIESGQYKIKMKTQWEINQNGVLHDILKRLKWNSPITVYTCKGKNKTSKDIPKYKAITFHSARKFFGKLLLDRGVSMYKVSQLLGHASVVTTEKFYAALSKDKLIEETTEVLNSF